MSTEDILDDAGKRKVDSEAKGETIVGIGVTERVPEIDSTDPPEVDGEKAIEELDGVGAVLNKD